MTSCYRDRARKRLSNENFGKQLLGQNPYHVSRLPLLDASSLLSERTWTVRRPPIGLRQIYLVV